METVLYIGKIIAPAIGALALFDVGQTKWTRLFIRKLERSGVGPVWRNRLVSAFLAAMILEATSLLAIAVANIVGGA